MKIIQLALPDYHVKEESDFNRIGFQVEEKIGNEFPNQWLAMRGISLADHLGKSANEMERKEDVYLDHARCFDNEISLKIPEGYRVVGAEKLAYSVENESGGFVSKAEVEGDQLIIKTRKYYKHNFEEAKDWPLMVEFFEAAYKFSQEKILLKKAS